jgi:hypothetical protein
MNTFTRLAASRAALLLFTFQPTAQASPAPLSTKDRCDIAIYNVSEYMKKSGINIVRVYTDTERLHSPPASRMMFVISEHDYKRGLPFLGNRKARQVMAEHILKNCPYVQMMSVAFDKTDSWTSHYRFPDGNVRPQICVAPVKLGDEEPSYPYGIGPC